MGSQNAEYLEHVLLRNKNIKSNSVKDDHYPQQPPSSCTDRPSVTKSILMQVQNRPVRFNGTVSSKRNLLGNRAGQAPPAWRNHGVAVPPRAAANGKGKEPGSKILLSKLPLDVGDKEVEVCFASRERQPPPPDKRECETDRSCIRNCSRRLWALCKTHS